jgi:hypothetical protein
MDDAFGNGIAYVELLASVKDKDKSQQALAQAKILDREDDANRQRIEDLTNRRSKLRTLGTDAFFQYIRTNTSIVRMLKTSTDRDSDKKLAELISGAYSESESSRWFGLGISRGRVVSEQRRIRKLMDDSWSMDWLHLTESKEREPDFAKLQKDVERMKEALDRFKSQK